MKKKDSVNCSQLNFPAAFFKVAAASFEALKKRIPSRTINGKIISRAKKSPIILWAASGINRKQDPRRAGLTAGSASNSQEINIYAAMAKGIYLYEPHGHKLIPVLSGITGVLAIARDRARSEQPLPSAYLCL